MVTARSNTSIPPRRAALSLAPDGSAPSRARQWASALLDEWRWTRPNDASLVISELCTNAVLHVGRPFELVLQRTPLGLRVEVHDQSSRAPARRVPGPDAPGGRGLLIVGALATWGWRPDAAGKVVWADLPSA